VKAQMDFDVVVVGAGPAGCHCARLLAKLGYGVFLAEQHEDFYQNDFSSAGTPLETFEQFDLPEEIAGSFWHKIVVVTTNITRTWEAPKTLGAVLSFAKLRAFLTQEVETFGGKVGMGYRYTKHLQKDGKTLVEFKQRGVDQPITVSTKILVDATGPLRAVMYDKESDKPEFLQGTGIEYLIEVSEDIYQKYADALIFFLGHKWIPRGYSWIFPMEPNRLKVGAGYLKVEHQIVKRTEPLRYYIELLIKDYLKTEDYQIIDVHGSTLKYSSGLNDLYYQDNIIAIGDAVSTVNFLGGEGIRHAMYSAEIACKHIEKYLVNSDADFSQYQKEMQQHFAPKWNISEKMGIQRYLIDSDAKIDKGIAYLSGLSAQDMVDVLFYYKFERLSKGLGEYLRRKMSLFWQKLSSIIQMKK
jgi:digeranylgeranylglycerophospholipid reductase